MHGSLQVQYQVSIVHHAHCVGVAFYREFAKFFQRNVLEEQFARKFRPAKYKRHTVLPIHSFHSCICPCNKDTGCHPAHCVGSHLWPKEHKPKRPYGHPRPKHKVTSLADDFTVATMRPKRRECMVLHM